MLLYTGRGRSQQVLPQALINCWLWLWLWLWNAVLKCGKGLVWTPGESATGLVKEAARMHLHKPKHQLWLLLSLLPLECQPHP